MKRICVVCAVALASCGGGKSKPTPPPSNKGSGSVEANKAKPSFNVTIAAKPGDTAIEGVVKELSGQFAIGATVVMTSPALVGEQVVLTDEKGIFFMGSLPEGHYVLTLYYNDQTFHGETDVAKDKVAKVAWAIDVKPSGSNGEVIAIDTKPPEFKTWDDALKAGAVDIAYNMGTKELAKKPSSKLQAMLAVTRWTSGLEAFNRNALGGENGPKAATIRKALTEFATDLEKTQEHLAAAAKDPQFSWEFCPACITDDGYMRLVRPGSLDVERDSKGKELPENDPRRKPTYHFDHGDLVWAKAMVTFHQAFVNIALAYDYDFIEKLAADNDPDLKQTITIKLVEPARIEKAKQLFLDALAASDDCRAEFLAETDDDREWVPNPKQKSNSSPLTVDAALYKTWGPVVEDVRSLVKGDTGLQLTALWKLFGEKKGAPAGFIDFGAMLTSPKDISITFGSLDAIEVEKNPKKRAEMTQKVLEGVLGNGFKMKMKPSKLTDRLMAVKKELDKGVEDKIKYVLWLN